MHIINMARFVNDNCTMPVGVFAGKSINQKKFEERKRMLTCESSKSQACPVYSFGKRNFNIIGSYEVKSHHHHHVYKMTLGNGI